MARYSTILKTSKGKTLTACDNESIDITVKDRANIIKTYRIADGKIKEVA